MDIDSYTPIPSRSLLMGESAVALEVPLCLIPKCQHLKELSDELARTAIVISGDSRRLMAEANLIRAKSQALRAARKQRPFNPEPLLFTQKFNGDLGVAAIDRHESIGVAAVVLQRNQANISPVM